MKKIIIISRCSWTLSNFRSGLMRKLVGDGYDVQAGGAAVGNGCEKRIESIGVKFNDLPVNENAISPQSDLSLFWYLYRWYRAEKPAVVHHFTIKPVVYGSIAAKFAGVPKIINTISGLGYSFNADTSLPLRTTVEFLYRIALKCSDFVFFQNYDDLELFRSRRLVSPAKSERLPGSGVDCEHFKPVLGSKRKEMDHVEYLMVARMLKDKGLFEFVSAARAVKAVAPNTRFKLLGKIDARNPLVVSRNTIDSWQKEGVVKYLGEVSDVRPFIGEADVIVLPSYYREGLPRALLEASAMSKPIITTDSVGCRDAVENAVNGLLVPVKDAESLAEAMLKLYRNPDLRDRMGKAGRIRAEREFDEKSVINKIIRKYG